MFAAIAPASAALQVDVNQGNVQPLPIAIPDFVAQNGAGQNIASVVRADLDRSGLFRPLDPKSFIEQINDINVPPDFANWRVITAQALVTGQAPFSRTDNCASISACGTYSAKARCWDCNISPRRRIGGALRI